MGYLHFFFCFSIFYVQFLFLFLFCFHLALPLFFLSFLFPTLKHLHHLVLLSVHSPLSTLIQSSIRYRSHCLFFISHTAHHSTPSLFAIYLQLYAQLLQSIHIDATQSFCRTLVKKKLKIYLPSNTYQWKPHTTYPPTQGTKPTILYRTRAHFRLLHILIPQSPDLNQQNQCPKKTPWTQR